MLEVLKALVERPGELVTREELRQRLWADDTFVDFEQGLNGIVRRLRDALGDSAEAPILIETLPRRGYRFIGVLEVGEPPAFAPAPPPGAKSVRRRVNVRQVALLIVVGVAAAALLGLLTASWLRHVATAAAVNAVPVTSYPGLEEDPSVSPDGQQVAFAWRGENEDDYNIFVKFIDRDEHLQLTRNPAIERRPAWSPDGKRIAFLRRRPNGSGSTIVVVPALGGTEQPVIDTTVVPGTPFVSGLSWTRDGKGLLFLDAAQSPSSVAIFVCWIDSRERHQLTTPAADFSDASPTIAPDGRRLAFVRRFSPFTNGRVFVQPLDGMNPVGEPHALTFDDSAMGVDWTADSRNVVFGTSDGLWRIRADGGSPEMVYPGRWYLSPSVAPHGRRLVFQHLTTDPNIWRVDGSQSAISSQEPTKVIASTHADTSPNISWDGRRIAYRSNRSGVTEIWVSKIDGSESVQLTHAGGRFVGSPRWSPDSESVAFDSMQSGAFTIFVVSAHGGDMHAVTHDGNSYRPSWSLDGRWIYFGSTQSETGRPSGVEQIWKIRSDGSGKAIQLTKNGGREGFASFDGKYVYYAKPRITPGIWRVPVDGGAEVKVLDRVIESSWGLTRHGIVFMDKLAWPQASIEFYGYDGTLRTRMLLPARLRFDPGNPTFSVAPDESSIVFTQLDSWGSDIEMIDGFR